jgi:ribosomal protein S4E
MRTEQTGRLKDGVHCNVIGGVHSGESGLVRNIKTGKTGFVSITVVGPRGEKFKTLAKNVVVRAKARR